MGDMADWITEQGQIASYTEEDYGWGEREDMAYQRNDDPNRAELRIFNQRNPGGNRPDEVGKIEITRPFLQKMVEFARDEGIMPILNVAIWNKTSARGNSYKSGSVSIQDAEYTRKDLERQRERDEQYRQRRDEGRSEQTEEEKDDGLFPF